MKYQIAPRSTSKRNQILDAAEQAILQKGVSATTIEELIFEVGVSKNGFFYHFQDKSQLIRAILDRNLQIDADWFGEILSKAQAGSNNPLERFLAFLDLLADEMNNMPEGHPGCMTTACCYQDRLLNDSVRQIAAEILMQWRHASLFQLREIAAFHPPAIDVNLEDLADMLPALIDGAIIFSRVIADRSVLPRQIRLYRTLIESTFKSEDT
ncbi:MAG: TetR/AcrR family transcriptional regulator [Hyphomicrobiales bacterium]